MTDILRATPHFQFMTPLNLDISNLFMTAWEILYDIRGKVKFYHCCDSCCNKREGGSPIVCVHKGVGAMDILHALIANESNCTKLVTFDRWFEELRDNYRIYPLEIEILEPKAVP